jgi:hypothetical protein
MTSPAERDRDRLAAITHYPRRWHMTRFPIGRLASVIEEDKTTADVERMLATAERRSFSVHVDPSQIAITRPGTPAKWLLRPQRHNPVSDAQWRDLEYLAERDAERGGIVVRLTEHGPRLGGHVGQLTTTASWMLIERGWVLLPAAEDGRARLSRAGRLNLAAHRAAPPRPKATRDLVIVPGHRTEAYEGRVLPNREQRTLFSSNGCRRGYHDRSGAGARCECGWTVAEASLSEARARARQHRIEQRAAAEAH